MQAIILTILRILWSLVYQGEIFTLRQSKLHTAPIQSRTSCNTENFGHVWPGQTSLIRMNINMEEFSHHLCVKWHWSIEINQCAITTDRCLSSSLFSDPFYSPSAHHISLRYCTHTGTRWTTTWISPSLFPSTAFFFFHVRLNESVSIGKKRLWLPSLCPDSAWRLLLLEAPELLCFPWSEAPWLGEAKGVGRSWRDIINSVPCTELQRPLQITLISMETVQNNYYKLQDYIQK